MILPYLLFIVGLLVLIKGGDWFVDGASETAKRFKIPELIIGATVVSIGTTLPEVMVSATSALQGVGDIAYGNAIGSVICNTALVAAITVSVKPDKVDRKSFFIPVIFFFVASIYYALTAYIGKEFTRVSGIILLVVFLCYIAVSVINVLKTPTNNDAELLQDESSVGNENVGMIGLIFSIYFLVVAILSRKDTTQMIYVLICLSMFIVNAVKPFILKLIKSDDAKNILTNVLNLITGAVVIAFGANLLVDNGQIIAKSLGVPDTVIALTFVALGTSLPELVTAITSLIKGHGALSLGNLVGANLFNIVLVSGLSITLCPFSVPNAKQFLGLNASLILDIPLMFLVMGILTVPTLISGKLRRIQGISLLLLYSAFIVVQFAF